MEEEDKWEYGSVGRRLMAGLLDWMIAIAWGALIGLLAAIGFYLIFNPTHGLQIGAGLIYAFPPVAFPDHYIDARDGRFHDFVERRIVRSSVSSASHRRH